MNRNDNIYQHYGWVLIVFVLFAVGAAIYFDYQTLGLTFVLSAAMLLLAMENSDMIHAVDMYELKGKKWRTFLVHWAAQRHIALFIFYYHIFVYGYLALFTAVIILTGIGGSGADTVINVLLIAIFLGAAGTILVRRIQVGSKYEGDSNHR